MIWLIFQLDFLTKLAEKNRILSRVSENETDLPWFRYL